MANGTNGTPHNAQNGAPQKPPRKADVIIQITRDISRKQEDVRNQTQLINSRLDSVAELSNQSKENAREAINKSDNVYNLVADSISALKHEITYLAAQSENIYLNLTDKLAELSKTVEDLKQAKAAAPQPAVVAEAPKEQVDYDAIADKLAERIPQPVYEAKETVIDYDLLSDKIAGKIPAPVVQNYSADAAPVAVAKPAEIDYDELSAKVAAHIPVQEAISTDYIAAKVAEQIVVPAAAEIDYDALAKKVAENVAAPAAPAPTPVVVTSSGDVTIDYEYLADKVANKILAAQPEAPAAVEIDYDALAEKVADKLHIEASVQAPAVEVDYDLLADKVAERINIEKPVDVSAVEIDLDALADKVAERVPAYQQVQSIAAALPSSQTVNIDEDALADKIALKVGSVNIDENALADKIALKVGSVNIDEDGLADKIAVKVGELKSDDFDIIVDDEGCNSISTAITEKLDYEAIADAVTERLRAVLDTDKDELDYDELANLISDKVHVDTVSEDVIADKAAAVLSNYLPDIDTDEIADKVADKVVAQVVNALPQKEEKADEEALQIELDYEDLAGKVATQVVNSLPDNGAEKRFNSIDKDLDEIKALLENGVKVSELAPVAAQTISEDEELVKVSDIVSDDVTDDPPEEPTKGEGVSDPKTLPSGDEESLEIGDELSETSGGVDFLNMMKYDRSFIARIIQGTDDQKEYYGKIKTALLTYKKVNSNIAWGAERFHKGRETIARLKIRGKTLILYLALDPAEFPYSVYHQKDVSDNKSLKGTPLSVKVMSPLGVKKAIRLIDAMLEKRNGIKRPIPERDYAAMYPYETIEELIADGLVHDVKKP